MRSILTTAVVLLASSIAFAYPAVNDATKLVGTVTMADGKSAPLVLEMKLTEFNASNASFKQVNTTTVGANAPQVEEGWVNASDLLSSEKVAEIMSQCTQYGGRFEDVQTKAGMFKTCALLAEDDNQEATYWVGDLAFGIVKADVLYKSEGYRINVTVDSFTNGK